MNSEKHRQFRSAMSCFATGITVVTAKAEDGEQLGVTANSFTSVSLEPPLVLVSLARSLLCLDKLLSAPAFAINLLACGQEELSMRFARSMGDKWMGVAHETSELGAPLLDQRLAHFECRPYARYEGGDHVILVGEVVHFESQPQAEPLVFYRGSYRRLEREIAA